MGLYAGARSHDMLLMELAICLVSCDDVYMPMKPVPVIGAGNAPNAAQNASYMDSGSQYLAAPQPSIAINTQSAPHRHLCAASGHALSMACFAA